MTAVTSTAKNSFFGSRCRNNLNDNKKVLIVNSILQLLSLPLISIIIILELLHAEDKIDIDLMNIEQLVLVAVLAFIISMLTGIIFALNSFRYLYTKSLADMHYSLPLTSKQRFFADYLTGLAAYVLPLIGGAILSIIILGIGNIFVDMKYFWEDFGIFFSLGIIVLIAMILFYTLAVLAITCCGNTFEAIFSIFAINIIIPVTILCVYFAVVACAGFGLDDEAVLYSNILTATSPVGSVIFFVHYMDNYLYTDAIENGTAFSMYMRWLLPTAVFIALFLIGTYFLYKNRKAESVSKPYVYKAFYFAIVTAAVFCILSTFIVNEASITAGIIICAILYLILEVASKRGFKRFWASILRYAATVAVVMIFCSVCESTYGFGASKYVPRASAVDSIELSMDTLGYYEDFSDKGVISAATDFHKDIIDRYFNADEMDIEKIDSESVSSDDNIYSYNGDKSIQITYKMKNGSIVMRSYECSSDMLDELVTAILISDEYAEMEREQLILDILNSGSNDVYYSRLSDTRGKETGNVILANKLGIDVDRRRLPYEKLEMLGKAYKTDLMAMTEENWKNASVYGYVGGHVILDEFANTIEILTDLGFGSAEITAEYLEEEADELCMGVYAGFEAYNTIDSHHENLKSSEYYYDYWSGIFYYSAQEKVTILDDFSYYENSPVAVRNIEFDEDFLELINAANPIVIGEKPAGAVCYTNEEGYIMSTLYVPDTEENRALLERVYSTHIEGAERLEPVYYD